ncbi:MAG: hypothetical protein P8I86_03705 [Luminiphilus sp.]|nr:hypothetical protein [Luminiphilus sp.]MDG2038689.1 hypothetical protein [Luminiphilus sp.]
MSVASAIESRQLSKADESALSTERQRLIKTVRAQLGASSEGTSSIEDDLSVGS